MKIKTKSKMEARRVAVANCQYLIDEIKSGAVVCNKPAEFIKSQEDMISDINAGKCDHTFSMRQLAISIQTGECHPLLP